MFRFFALIFLYEVIKKVENWKISHISEFITILMNNFNNVSVISFVYENGQWAITIIEPTPYGSYTFFLICLGTI